MKAIIFMGPQGSGKGTQVKKLHERLVEEGKKVFLLDTGAALRRFSEEKGELQEKVKASLARGELQPVFLIVYILGRELVAHASGYDYLVIDGSPRTRLQAEVLDSAFGLLGCEEGVHVCWIEVSDAEALERLLKRGRNDDTREGIAKRLAWSRENANAILDFYAKSTSYAVHSINGQQSPEAVHADIISKLDIHGK